MSFNSYLREVSPRVVTGEDGNLERGWSCRSLLRAMYVMLYLDLTAAGQYYSKVPEPGMLKLLPRRAAGQEQILLPAVRKQRLHRQEARTRALTRRRFDSYPTVTGADIDERERAQGKKIGLA